MVIVTSAHAASAKPSQWPPPRGEEAQPTPQSPTPVPDPPPPFEISFYLRGWLGYASGTQTTVPTKGGATYGMRFEMLVPKRGTFGLSHDAETRWSIGPYAELGANGMKNLLVGGGLVVHSPMTWSPPIAPSVGV